MAVGNITFAPIQYENATKTFTVRQIFEALKANGFKHLRGQWSSINGTGKVVGGCAIQQAAMNLGVPASFNNHGDSNLFHQLNSLGTVPPTSRWYRGELANNDLGEVIVYWNDAPAPTGPAFTKQGHRRWALRYWYQIVEMAQEILEPYFDQIVTLPHYEY